MGTMQSSERFCQVTDKIRLADVQGGIFETRVTNGCFTEKQTLSTTVAMSELRTKPTGAYATKNLSTKQIQAIMAARRGRLSGHLLATSFAALIKE